MTLGALGGICPLLRWQPEMLRARGLCGSEARCTVLLCHMLLQVRECLH